MYRFLFLLISLAHFSQAHAAPNVSARDFSTMLPVSTPSLTPGEVHKRPLKQTIRQPLFIVGADPMSHRWLKRHRDYLARIKAKGIVVDVRTVSQLQALMNYDLPMYPIQGHEFADIFSITHYPVLLHEGELKQ
ncbi:integrating conjugative element protein [Vibrio sp. 10N.261.46.A3]|uniref:integrating conjugative element protein n=1 Tax=Vibrio sp. 10N.261.46.A3 TaxID=3229658 RepID=UPI00354D7625